MVDKLLLRLKQKRTSKVTNKDIVNVVKQQSEKLALDLNPINSNYKLLLSEPNVNNPFVIDSGLIRIIRNYTRFYPGKEDRARAVFNWIENNIDYGNSEWYPRYRNSSEVLKKRKGVCGEMVFLYITMARSVGLKCSYVAVRRDCNNQKVHHACAIVDAGRKILVDPAYNTFDIHHCQYKVLSDKEVIECFKQWR
jgi:hypothetical protein